MTTPTTLAHHKRLLTPEEITWVCSGILITTFRKEISEQINNFNHATIRNELKNLEIYPECLDDLKLELENQYFGSQVHPGESVGILTAQSIGENQTQLMLNSFHFSGLSIDTVISGAPRFSEILGATKNPKHVMSSIYFHRKHKKISALRKTIGSSVVYLEMNKFIKHHEWYLENGDRNEKCWYDDAFFQQPPSTPTTATHVCLQLQIDTELCFQYEITLKQLSECIKIGYSDLICVYSPMVFATIDIWVPTGEIPTEKISVYLVDDVLPLIKSIQVGGIPKIDNIFYEKTDDYWFAKTSGSNMKSLFSLKSVDETRTICNNMWEIYEVLGIEAVRAFLIQEFLDIISVDAYINRRHIKLLVDIMTYTGIISPINRYGVDRTQSGPLTKCSFEESLDNFLQSGIYGETENTRGVSAAIMIGKASNVGTGLCELIYK
jgi:DNA-directed RNA polymerase II subunit RPB1